MKSFFQNTFRILILATVFNLGLSLAKIDVFEPSEAQAQWIGLPVRELLLPALKRCVQGAAACFGIGIVFCAASDVYERVFPNHEPEAVTCEEWAAHCMEHAQCQSAENPNTTYNTAFCGCMAAKPNCSQLARDLGCNGEQAGN